MLHEISYRALPSDLVEKITIDLGDYHIGDSVKVGDLEIAKNDAVDLLTDPESIIFSIAEPHTAAEAEGEETEGEEA